MKFNELKKSVLNFLGLNVLTFIVNLVVKTYQIEIKNDNELKKITVSGSSFIAAFWHGRMLIPWYIHRKYKIAALVSKSKDGEMLTRLLKNWNYNVVRGSSHVGGKEALNLMGNKIEEGYSFAITPDGPTGPVNQMKAGAVVLAQRKSVPLFLIGTASSRKFIFKSWDKFQVPKPFSKVSVVYSDPIYVDKDINREEVEMIIENCGKELIELQKEAERIVNNHT